MRQRPPLTERQYGERAAAVILGGLEALANDGVELRMCVIECGSRAKRALHILLDRMPFESINIEGVPVLLDPEAHPHSIEIREDPLNPACRRS